MDTIQIAKFFMKLWEVHPISPDKEIGGLQEVFQHPKFLDASESEKKEIMFRSACFKYENELNYPWDNYFGLDLAPLLNNKVVLDLGCFNGGRSTAWHERYDLDCLSGIDVDQIYIDAATQFANIKKINANFKLAKGEKLPFENAKFDAILSFDVFEHVQNIEDTLDECLRVLKPGGKLFVVFPSWYHPIEHHLSLVTKTPFFHYFFRSRTLIKAYFDIIEERGENAYWYKRNAQSPKSWERGNTVNGTTLSGFKKLLSSDKWKILLHSKKPIGSVGRSITKKKSFVILSRLLSPLTLIPGIREIFLHRITFILEKIE
jgi:SAM-dependent methyltransferase